MSWTFWAVASALFAALTALLAKRGVEHLDSNVATAVRTTVVFVLSWFIACLLARPGSFAALDRKSLGFLVASGLMTALSWLCYFRALSLGPVSKVAPLDKLSVVFVLLLAWPVLGEKLTTAKVVGAVLISAGAVVLTLTP